jgi:starch synthase
MTIAKTQIRNIWMVSREYGELAGAGGVKDVVLQLAEALAGWSHRQVRVVLPRYGFMNAESHGFAQLVDPDVPDDFLVVDIDMHEPEKLRREQVRYFVKKINKVMVYLVDSPRFSEKTEIYTYSAVDEQRVWWQKRAMGHYDYFAMNLLLQKAALQLMICLGEKPDIIHCHDGHTALIPALTRELEGFRDYFRRSPSLVTIHNAGYGYHQEIADIPYAKSTTGLPEHIVDEYQLERKFDPFLVAGHYGLLNTVSENYARELQATEKDRLTGWLGHELLRRGVVLAGVTNGIEPKLMRYGSTGDVPPDFRFEPGDPSDDLRGKARCKAEVLSEVAVTSSWRTEGVERFGGLDGGLDKPLYTFIGRLSGQKGVDLLTATVPQFLAAHEQPQLLVLGSGAPSIETPLIDLATSPVWRGRICFLRGFDPMLAAKIYAAGDFFVIPSRFEPCGLTDFIAQLYGNIPIVHHVGGLVKVRDMETGIAFHGENREALLEGLVRGLAVYDDPQLKRQIQLQAVAVIYAQYTWDKVMHRYLQLYHEAHQQLSRRGEG